jgi:LAO/AO transport system kinase
MTAPRLSVDDYVAGIRDRAILARAITLVESDRDEDRALAERVLAKLKPHDAVRIGITGVPGVGKSTLIESFGLHLVDAGKKVAVLAVDPSSTITGGSILGDKTRMPKLSAAENAFIRPSPSALTLGGVARRTRETMHVCEAAGYDVVIVETVGVGQSETAVANMVDTFVLLALPGAGDELQGIKKGILELADIVAVNKCDGDNQPRATSAVRELKLALGMVQRRHPSWAPEILMTSGLVGTGIPELWSAIGRHRAAIDLEALRRTQSRASLSEALEEETLRALRSDEALKRESTKLEEDVAAHRITSAEAARKLLALFRR